MKRLLIMFMVLGLVVGSAATAEASKKKRTRIERTVEGTYGPFPAPVTGCSDPLGPYACLHVTTRAAESFFTAKVTDTHGQPVFVQVDTGAGWQTFCGETTRPITFPSGVTLRFFLGVPVWPAELNLGCPAHRVKTTGTISVTLSNLVPQKSVPARSGSILSGTGWVLDGSMGGCQVSPQCAAWLQSDCDPVSAGRDPGLTASIVDVGTLADGPSIERAFRFGPDDLWTPVWGGVQLQFWKSDCTEISDARWRSTDCGGDERGRRCQSTRLRIPPSAKWMTVTGSPDNVNLTWTLS